MSEERIRFVDLGAQYRELAEQIDASIEAIVHASAFIGGAAVDGFEHAYAQFAEVEHCIGVSSGTDAIELALRACGIEGGSEVILPTNSFIATAEAVVRAGAVPVLVDADPITHLIDVGQVIAGITDRTRAIIPVHLYGQVAPTDELVTVLDRRPEIALVEDAAQAHGATRHGRSPGAIGRVAATSFYPGKNLGAFGDAGAVLTNDGVVADHVRLLRDHGSREKYVHETLGFNCRLDGIQAAVLDVKLTRLASWNDARRAIAQRYLDALADRADVQLPVVVPGNEAVWHLFVVQVDDRDRILARLQSAGIEAGIHYPVPIHLQPAFADYGNGPGSLPNAERTAGRLLSLPMHPHLTESQQERVLDLFLTTLAEVAP